MSWGKGLPCLLKKHSRPCINSIEIYVRAGGWILGVLWLYRGVKKNVLNFPTKKHWRYPSKAEYVSLGLDKFLAVYERLGITSISFPMLGTGNGGLDWESVVRPLMEQKLGLLPIPVYIHLCSKPVEFVPEHKLPTNIAIPLEVLLDDLNALRGKTLTGLHGEIFRFEGVEAEHIVIFSDDIGGAVNIPLDYIKMIWDDLHIFKVLSPSKLPYDISRYHTYIIGLFQSVPYLSLVGASTDPSSVGDISSQSLVLVGSGGNGHFLDVGLCNEKTMA